KAEYEDGGSGAEKQVVSYEIPSGIDRRKVFMRTTMIGAMSVVTGEILSAQEKTQKAASGASSPGAPPEPQLSPNLNVVKQEKGPVTTVMDAFYKVAPGPS